MGAKIGAASEALPTFGYSEHTWRPHVEVDASGYHYVVAERGQEYEHYTTSDLDELLYRIFADITFQLSARYELTRRVEAQDCRRILFQHPKGAPSARIDKSFAPTPALHLAHDLLKQIEVQVFAKISGGKCIWSFLKKP